MMTKNGVQVRINAWPPFNKKMIPSKSIGDLLTLTFLICIMNTVNALIRVQVNQRTDLLSYDDDYADLHAYFNVGYDQQGQMVQADSVYTYHFSKISQKSASRYQFVRIPHATGVPEQVYGNVQLYNQEIYGLCTFNGNLDYIVGLDIPSNEVRVMRIQNTSTNTQYVYDYKVVDKDSSQTKLKGTVFVDCQYQGQFLNKSYYTLGIAGTYFHSNQISSYFLAKFSTKYNFTEYFIISEDPQTMEAARGVKVDIDNKMIYLAVEVNKQKYFNRTVYAPGQLPGVDNANVAIHGYSWTHGVRQWTTLIGNPKYTDAFGRMKNYGNFLYVFLNSFSETYSTNTSQTDIYYYRMRASNGFIEAQRIFGSPTDDKIYDLEITFTGIYILARIGDYFLPHRYNDRFWGTRQLQSNLVVIWMSLYDFIYDMEGFAFSDIDSPYPTKLLVPRTVGTSQFFVFIAPRTNSDIDLNGGFLITYLEDNNMFFSQNLGCGETCSKCSPLDTSICIQCANGYTMFENQCYSTGCPTFSYLIYDDSSTSKSLNYCKKCHYTCKTCSGPNPDQCSSCCTDNTCGPIYNRQPNLGKCPCPAGLVDVNGICQLRCTVNLAGKGNELCYPQCPGSAYPSIQYDQATAQERSQYDSTSTTDCSQSFYHLQFFASGKGLPVQGQPDLAQVPQNFTISLWVRPIALNSPSYFFNVYNRISVRAVSSTQRVFYAYRTGSSTSLEPTTYTNDAKQRVTIGSWNFVAISQREFLSANIQRYEQLLAIGTTAGGVQQAGYGNTVPVVRFPSFSNNIYIGGFSDQTPQSFTGYLKEFKIFTKFHGLAQLQDEMLRMYRFYSYDDPNLVAYWKFNETYTSSDVYYVINDYSSNQNQISYFKTTTQGYPQYAYDQSASLTLCIFHDVAVCQSPSFRHTQPYVVDGKRLTSLPTFNLPDSLTLTKADGDQVWFMPNNTGCSFNKKLAYMTFQGNFVQNWIVPDPTQSPINLLDGQHYQVCYYIAAKDVAFNVYQQYLINKPKTIDPSNNDAYMSDGVIRTFFSSGGDQSYGDVLKFSLNCSTPISADYEMKRDTRPSYGTQAIKSFTNSGDYNLCWSHIYMQELSDSYYESVHGLRFRIVGVPKVANDAVTTAIMNQDLARYSLTGGFAEGDKIAFAWRGTVPTDCNPTNFVGSQITRSNYYWPSVWFGYTSGVSGVANYSMDTLHMCFKSAATDAPDAWSRIPKISSSSYQLQFLQYDQANTNGRCPEPIAFTPTYGSTQLYETDNTIQFVFKSQTVYPSLQSDGTTGKIAIFRGAIGPEGRIVKTTTTLWFNFGLNDTLTPNPFQQGDLICSGTGSCSIILSQQSNKMKAGEIYFLSFYKESFSYKPTASSTTKYYLFNSKVLDTAGGQTTAYDHLFFCRSFFINNSTQLINGRTFTMSGIDLLSKVINAKLSGNSVTTATFSTKAINLYLTVINTLNTYCVSSPPVATVQMNDVQTGNFTVRNLELRQCNVGTLMANVELIRGIRDQYGQFTHLRSEWQKNVQIGIIGCDSTCMFCNGTTPQSCLVCTDTTQKIFMGACSASCPNTHPYFIQKTAIIQRQEWNTYECINQCPLGYYPDPNTKQCMECNEDCQTCASQKIASCITCEPIKYLYNGVCLTECPSPHHQSNFTSYTCDEISRATYLSVKIQSLGYDTKIPKDQQQYLKASISNQGGGTILTILWEQLEPSPDTDEVTIFSSTPGGDLLNRQAVIKLKMTAFNYMASDQVVKVQVTVVNSLGEIAYDIYEFYQNQPPVAGDSTITALTNVGLGGGIAGDSIYRITLTAWDDTIAVGEDPLKFKLYMVINGNYYTITDQTFLTDFYFRLPLLSNDITDTGNKTIQVCVQCTDNYFATTLQCQRLTNLTNKVSFLTSLGDVRTHLQSLSYTGNMTNCVYAGNLLYMTAKKPKRISSQPSLCNLDFQCNGNGKCNGQFGSYRCVCNQGYSGTFCQFQESQFLDLQNIANEIILNLYNTMLAKPRITPNDIEVIGTVLRGVLRDPDLVSDNLLDEIVATIELVGSQEIFAFMPLSQSVRQIYFDALDSVFQKLFHQQKVRTAYPDGAVLARGKSIFDQYSASTSQRRVLASSKKPGDGGKLDQIQVEDRVLERRRKRNLNSKVWDQDSQEEVFASEENEHKEYLIGGAKNRNKPRKLSSVEDYNQNMARRIDEQISIFVERHIQSLNPENPKFSYSTDSIDLSIYALYANAFPGQTMYIKERDFYWQFPDSLFDQVQGYASNVQYLGFRAQKYKTNPFIFEKNPGGFLESNVTDLTFYDAAMNHIDIDLSDSYAMIKEPFNKTQTYSQELLTCMAWDTENYQFIDDGSCSMNIVYDAVPCYSCDEDTILNLTITQCRCTHLSRFAAVYKQTWPSAGMGVKAGIYSDFFAMQYWMNSFGFFAVLAGACTYLTGILIFMKVDQYAIPKVMEQLKERIRRLELKGFQQKPKHKKLIVKRDFDGNIIFIRNPGEQEQKKKEEEEKKKADKGKVAGKKGKLQDDKIESTPVTQLQKPAISKKGGKGIGGKKFNNDNDPVDDNDLINAKGKPKKAAPSKGGPASKHPGSFKDFEEDQLPTQRSAGGPDELNNTQVPKNDYSKIENDLFEQQMMKRYEEEKEIHDFIKVHGTSSSEEDMAEKMRSKEQKRYLKIERKAKEMYWYHWKNLIIHGNYISSILYIPSFLAPRHARWTLLFTSVLLNWFWCAVLYNNTKNPLELPDFSRKASSLAGDDLWISIVSPFGTIVLMYVFAGIFKVSDERLVQSYTMIYLEQMLVELKKEMKLRFTIAYMITMAVYAVITWYVIKFSATFGWKVSWTWFYSGLFAIFIQFAIYDNLVSIIHWITYYCSRTLAIFWMKVRILKQAKSEGR